MRERLISFGDPESAGNNLEQFVPGHLMDLARSDAQRSIPAIAKDADASARIERQLHRVPTTHRLLLGDAREIVTELPQKSVHLAITSPPYWTLGGASTREHPAPFPHKLAERLIRMFSFVGDTILDPFMGTGTSCAAAAGLGRNSIGIEVEPSYYDLALSAFAERQRAQMHLGV